MRRSSRSAELNNLVERVMPSFTLLTDLGGVNVKMSEAFLKISKSTKAKIQDF